MSLTLYLRVVVLRIRSFTTMRYINLRFTYLLTYLQYLVNIAFVNRQAEF